MLLFCDNDSPRASGLCTHPLIPGTAIDPLHLCIQRRGKHLVSFQGQPLALQHRSVLVGETNPQAACVVLLPVECLLSSVIISLRALSFHCVVCVSCVLVSRLVYYCQGGCRSGTQLFHRGRPTIWGSLLEPFS